MKRTLKFDIPSLLRPYLNEQVVRDWLFTPSKPCSSEFNRNLFSMAIQHRRYDTTVTEINSILEDTNIVLPVMSCENLALGLNFGPIPPFLDKSWEDMVIIRKSCFNHGSSRGLEGVDVIHFSHGFSFISVIYHDEYGQQVICVGLFGRKPDSMDIDFSRPPIISFLQAQIAPCIFCVDRDSCRCPAVMRRRWVQKKKQRPLGSLTNWLQYFSHIKEMEIDLYAVRGADLIPLKEGVTTKRLVEKVNIWNFVAVKYLSLFLPVSADINHEKFLPQTTTQRSALDADVLSNRPRSLRCYQEEASLPTLCTTIQPSLGSDNGSTTASGSGTITGSGTNQTPLPLFQGLDTSDLLEAKNKKLAALQCSLCQLVFTKTSNLKRHVDTVHNVDSTTTQQNIACHVCMAYFRRSSQLRTHIMEIHNIQSPFECQSCSLSFVSKGNLNKHVRMVHEKVYKYECQMCHEKFFQKYNFERHMKNNHAM